MKTLVYLAMFLLASTAYSHDGEHPETGEPGVVGSGVNAEIRIVLPAQDGRYPGYFVVETRNFSYVPEFATNPRFEFAVGVDALGDPLRFGEGHLHGWVFQVDKNKEMIRNDAGVPTPASYLRFYGALGAEFMGDAVQGYYVKTDELPNGNYRAFFQLQQNDHTGMKQASAPAFPGIASVDFRVRNKPSKPPKSK